MPVTGVVVDWALAKARSVVVKTAMMDDEYIFKYFCMFTRRNEPFTASTS